MEVCVDSIQSAINAEQGGASRLELCSNLVEGGITPSLGLLRVIKDKVKIPVYVMVRPRGGDFLYSEDEFRVMKEDVMFLKENGADGIVFGILTADGDIDVERSKEIITMARPLLVTFHRAFDMTRDPLTSLDTLISLGVERVLTSGQDSTALEGLPLISRLIEHAQDKIIVVPGGGITERNLGRILKESGAKEFHCSARSSCNSLMVYRNGQVSMGASYGPPEFGIKVTDRKRVEQFVMIAAANTSSVELKKTSK